LFTACCGRDDYKVTVGGVPCPIQAFSSNACTCAPSQERPPESDLDQGGSRVLVISFAQYFTIEQLAKNANLFGAVDKCKVISFHHRRYLNTSALPIGLFLFQQCCQKWKKLRIWEFIMTLYYDSIYTVHVSEKVK